MTPALHDLIPPRILVLDDERQIHASLRLRLNNLCEPISCYKPLEALAAITKESFDLCIVDIRMPEMDGLTFIERARQVDPGLGYIILTAYDSEENLRRAIPLNVYALLPKPFPDRAGFEQRLPEWIAQTRSRRREINSAVDSGALGQDLELARIERDVESTASESAKEALLQTANLLTTLQALLLNASFALDKPNKSETPFVTNQALRSLQEARKIAETAAAITEGYFHSAYSDRESSPALISSGLRNAVAIGTRLARAEEQKKAVDLTVPSDMIAARGLTGIDFLLMCVPALSVALELTSPDTTIRIHCEEIPRMEPMIKDVNYRQFLWVNRKLSAISQSGVRITIRASAPAMDANEVGTWLRGDSRSHLRVPSRGLLHGLQKSRGLLGFATRPSANKFEMVLLLPI